MEFSKTFSDLNFGLVKLKPKKNSGSNFCVFVVIIKIHLSSKMYKNLKNTTVFKKTKDLLGKITKKNFCLIMEN